MRNKKSGSEDRVGSAMAHQQGSVHIPIEGQAHTHTHRQAHTRTGLSLVTQGSKKLPGTGGRNSANDAYYTYSRVDHAGVSKSP